MESLREEFLEKIWYNNPDTNDDSGLLYAISSEGDDKGGFIADYWIDKFNSHLQTLKGDIGAMSKVYDQKMSNEYIDGFNDGLEWSIKLINSKMKQ